MSKLKGKLLVLKISLLFMSFPCIYLYKSIQYKLFPKKIDEELRENLQKLSDMFKAKPVMIVLGDVDRTEIDVSSVRSMRTQYREDKILWELTLRTKEEQKFYYTTRLAMDLDYAEVLGTIDKASSIS